MRILIVGATGTVGKAVADLLSRDHEVLGVSNSRGDLRVNLGSKKSILKLYESVGAVDAVVSAAGASVFGKLADLRDEDFNLAIQNKLMGQINLVRAGLDYVSENGSFTLTGGLLARNPWPSAAPAATVNAALEGFVRAAALDLPAGIRINVVAPALVTETAVAWKLSAEGTVSAAKTAEVYRFAVGQKETGKVFDVTPPA